MAQKKEVHILRKKDNQLAGEDIKVNYEAILKGKEKDVILQPYDIVDVGELSAMSGKKITDMLTGLPLILAGKLP